MEEPKPHREEEQMPLFCNPKGENSPKKGVEEERGYTRYTIGARLSPEDVAALQKSLRNGNRKGENTRPPQP